MQKDVLLEIVKQNQHTSAFSFDRITEQNSGLRLNDRTASIGFIYRHIGETINLFSQFLGIATDVRNTTMGEIHTGQHFDIGYSRESIERGFSDLGDGAFVPLQDIDNAFQYSATLSWTKGNHNIKAGASFLRRQARNVQSASAAGAYGFGLVTDNNLDLTKQQDTQLASTLAA